MSIRPISFPRSAILIAALGICAGVFAQTPAGEQPLPTPVTEPPSASSTNATIFPATRSTRDTFIGIAIGKPTYSTSCGNIAGLSCSNNGTSVSVTAGNMFTRNWGAELSYLDLGKADRAGGSVDARGVNVSVVGRLPLGDNFALEGKIGGTYGITHVNPNPLSGLPSGRSSGFGLGYGVAFNVNFTHGLQASIGWEQHDFHFAGQGMSTVQNITLGVAYRF